MKKVILIISIIVVGVLLIFGAIFMFKKINFKSHSILEKGSIVQEQFKSEVSFELENGWTIIPVDINGKSYKFILDTGALNIVSLELAEELGLKKIGNSNGRSSTGQSQPIDLAELSNVNIGGIEFLNTTTAIIDIKNQFKCYDIDGLIGSNLMRFAIWEINNQTKNITLTNSIDSLNIKDFNDEISFSTNQQSNPYLNLSFADTKINTLFDTGHNGKILMNNSFLKDIPKSIIKKKIEFKGSTSQGIFTKGIDTTSIVSHCKIKTFKIDTVNINDYIVTFTKGDSKIGNTFFSKYNYILDWSQKLILLKKFEDEKTQEYISYGFGKSFNNNIVSVGEIMIDSEASVKLELQDQILEFNGKDWKNLNQSEWCHISKNKEWTETLILKIKRGELIKEITIEKKKHIE